MVSIEQVRLLEKKVVKAIDYVNRVTEENTLLKNRVDGYQKRIDELEVLIQRFKEDQGRIEESIVSALDKLNRFEDAVENTIARDDFSNDFSTVPHPYNHDSPQKPVPVAVDLEVKDDLEDELELDTEEDDPALADEDDGGNDEQGAELDIF